jgi:DNA-binding protein YbaB
MPPRRHPHAAEAAADKENEMTQPDHDYYKGLANQAFLIRDEFAAAASELEEAEVTRISGSVTVTLSPSGAMRALKIDPSGAGDIAALERDVMLAHEAAATAIRQMAEHMLSPLRDLVEKATHEYSHTNTHPHR